jgi:hypothetical protein
MFPAGRESTRAARELPLRMRVSIELIVPLPTSKSRSERKDSAGGNRCAQFQ